MKTDAHLYHRSGPIDVISFRKAFQPSYVTFETE